MTYLVWIGIPSCVSLSTRFSVLDLTLPGIGRLRLENVLPAPLSNLVMIGMVAFRLSAVFNTLPVKWLPSFISRR